MEKKVVSNLIIMLGCLNWVIAITIITMILLLTTKAIPYALGAVMGYYIAYSYIPALASGILTIKVKQEHKAFNLIINIVFLLLYTLAYLFSWYMGRNG
ncbi:MAG: hypothetical protein GX660_13080 [Clostridiaceae bacterium]|nr:hypothetical protein [Clostridiaceae bacterium]